MELPFHEGERRGEGERFKKFLRNSTSRALALGGSRLLSDLFATAGCKFEFSAKAIQTLTKLLQDELKKL